MIKEYIIKFNKYGLIPFVYAVLILAVLLISGPANSVESETKCEISSDAARKELNNTRTDQAAQAYLSNMMRKDAEIQSGLKISDSRIRDEIKAAFKRDSHLVGYEIFVKSANGAVDLNGMVDRAFEKEEAGKVASRVEGVISVDNNLIVKDFSNTYTFDPWVHDYYLYENYWYGNMRKIPEKSDPEILNAIRDELLWSPYVDADKVDVKVDDGIATLTGKVDSWLAYNTALQNAYQGGAIYVYNKLTLR